jgi:hypothetical protein
VEQNLLKTLADEVGALRVDNIYKDLVIAELNRQINSLNEQIKTMAEIYEPQHIEETEPIE